MSTNEQDNLPYYGVLFESHAERYFIKSFQKKYGRAWDVTRKAIENTCARIDGLIGQSNLIETIAEVGGWVICKCEFSVAGTNKSPHGSGNRYITSVNHSDRVVRILLVYGKGDVVGRRETTWWKENIKENYSEYKDL